MKKNIFGLRVSDKLEAYVVVGVVHTGNYTAGRELVNGAGGLVPARLLNLTDDWRKATSDEIEQWAKDAEEMFCGALPETEQDR